MLNLTLYATLFRLTPFGKASVVRALRKNAEVLRNKNTTQSMDEACSYLIGAGFLSLDLQQFSVARTVADSLSDIYDWYLQNDGTTAQKMRAHGNMLLFQIAVQVLGGRLEDLKNSYDELQKNLSLVIVESAQYGNRWRPARERAALLQLYLDWILLGPENQQTWRTVDTMSGSISKDIFQAACTGWFDAAPLEWQTFVTQVQEKLGHSSERLV